MFITRRSPNRKPNQPVAINRGHPMAQGIEAFFYHPSASAGMWDAVSGRFLPPSTGTWNIKATVEGQALATTNATASLTARNPLAKTSQGVTIIARYRLKSLPASDCPVICYDRAAFGRGIYIGGSSTQAHAWGVNSSNGMIVAAGLGSGELNKFHTIGCEHHETTDVTVYGWVDGVAQGSAAGSGSSIGVALTTLTICGNFTNYENFPDVEILWIAAFNRRLSDAEHAWWHRNAFAVLAGRRLLRLSIATSGGGPADFANPLGLLGVGRAA